MKYILLVFCILFALSCEHKPSKYLVRAVHNTCTGKWAVQTGESVYLGSRTEEIGYSYTTGKEYFHTDTVDDAKPGDELQFSSIENAIKAYIHWRGNPDTVIKYREIAAAKREREKAISDSIFKCNHTYK